MFSVLRLEEKPVVMLPCCRLLYEIDLLLSSHLEELTNK
jgi:hypothetical protein